MLKISDIIQIIGIIAATATSIFSIIIAVIAIKQNHKMLEDTTRPYILISYEVINTGYPHCFFLLKNYGTTGAKIEDFKYDMSLNSADIIKQFDKIPGIYLAPGQKKLYWFDARTITSDELSFVMTYSSSTKRYREDIVLKINNGAVSLRNSNSKTLDYSLQEIVERLI